MNAYEKFAPLLPEEIAEGRILISAIADDDEIVAPVPLDAAPLDVKFKGHRYDEVLWFLNEKNERLFAECRWNHRDGGKEVRPACLTDHGWKLVAFPAPRPLYNLDKLAAWPARPVWLFEGPRKADKAGRAFRLRRDGRLQLAARTQSSRPDFLALRGRDVDPLARQRRSRRKVDGPDDRCASRRVGVASIRVVNVAKVPANLTERFPEAKRGKFDVVDLIEAGIAPETIREAAETACRAGGYVRDGRQRRRR